MNLFRSKLLPIVCLAASISAAWAVDKGGAKFTPPPIESIESKQTNDSVTVAVKPYNNETDAKTAFGKVNPYEHGILPVLVIVQNNSKKSIRLSGMKPEYISPNRDRIEATPASEVKYTKAPKRPSMNPGPIPGIKFSKKNPLTAEEIEGRAFSAQMLPPGEVAHGFVYFQTGFRRGSSFYLTGVEDASTGQDLFYFDIPMQ
jgi:hypothetical protein